MKAINWNEEDLGSTYVAEDIPDDLLSKCEELREQMIEAAADLQPISAPGAIIAVLFDNHCAIRQLLCISSLLSWSVSFFRF